MLKRKTFSQIDGIMKLYTFYADLKYHTNCKTFLYFCKYMHMYAHVQKVIPMCMHIAIYECAYTNAE